MKVKAGIFDRKREREIGEQKNTRRKVLRRLTRSESVTDVLLEMTGDVMEGQGVEGKLLNKVQERGNGKWRREERKMR